MSPITAAALVVMVGALTALPYLRFHGVVTWAAAGAVVAGLVSLLGYFWNAVEIITDRFVPPVAFNTAVSLALLGTGILLSPGKTGVDAAGKFTALAALETKILGGFIVALSLLLASGTYTYRTTVQVAVAADSVAHTQEVRAALASLYGSLAGAEVARRDAVLSSEASHRDEYLRSTRDVQLQLGTLRRLTADNSEQVKNVAALAALVEQERDSDSTQRVRELTDHMAAIEERLLAARQAATTKVRETTLVSLLATLAVASGLFTAFFRGIRREMLARRSAESALRVSEQYNRSIIHSSPDSLCVLALDGRIQQITPQGRRLMDIDESAHIAEIDWLSLWAGPDRAAASAALDAARSGKSGRFEGHRTVPGGATTWWDVIIMPVIGAQTAPERLLAVARDISEVKRSESDLREANRFLDSLIEHLPVMIVLKDADTLHYVRVNGAVERLLGYSREQMIGRSVRDLFPAEDAAAIIASDRQALEHGGLVDNPEHRVQTATLGLRTFHTMKMPITDGSGRARYVMSISTDITERKLAEQAIQELNWALVSKAEQLTASNRELESFSYSVSHDLRAPLRAVDGFAQMLEEDYVAQLDAEGMRYLSVIRGNIKRLGALIDDLLEFSRLGRLPVSAEEINVESLVREVVAEALDGCPTAPRVEFGPLPPARGDRALLRQVWTNLITNAIKYSGKAAEPRIEVCGRQDAAENIYWVRDNGVGFNMQYADKLFGVFQRLHRADEFSGTGVGLAIVQRVVARHGGRVWADGKVNDGAIFFFSIPVQVTDG
jgi:PAS domain S-box-containing protein